MNYVYIFEVPYLRGASTFVHIMNVQVISVW